MITILDYGIGNLGSIANMLRKIGYPTLITSSSTDVMNASKLILPGVGAFDAGMSYLKKSGLLESLNLRALEDKIPVLGICLGAQLMTKGSEEGDEPGLGWLNATTRKFRLESLPGRWPLPNIGWRDVNTVLPTPLLSGYESAPRFYFVHSYHMVPEDNDIGAMTSSYGVEFVCGLRRDNLHCVQFHPEKSHRFGMQLLKNFAELI